MGQAQVVADAFALGQVRAFGHAADGPMSRIWRLDATSGCYAVKEFRIAPDDETPTRLEASALLADAVRRAGVRTPRSVRSSTGSLLHGLHDHAAADVTYVSVATWIDGRTCEVRRDAETAAAWLGETLAAIELVPDPPNPPPLDPWLAGWLTESPTEAQWCAVLDQAYRAGRPWAEVLESRIPRLANLTAVVGSPSNDRQSMLHTDLQPKNVLVTSTGFALLDWDDAALCSRDLILGRTLVEWLTPDGVHTDAITRFLRSYRARGGSGAIADLSHFGYAAAAHLNHVHEAVTSDLADDHDDGNSAWLVTAALTNPLDLSTLEHVLDILRTAE
ncbi:phosphotransferase [Actinopolymorpha rutila]|uniref:phosphotransferase n=1 Tax=Actinopolymorpha rutila TaxID=446787 RepID=UPI00307F2B6B